MSLFGSEHWMYSSGAASFYDHQIDGSLRFNRPDSAYLSRTPSSAGNRRTWTFSCWYKPTLASNDNNLFSCGTGSSDVGSLYFQHGGSNSLYWYDVEGGTLKWYLITTQVFRDPSAWYHVVAVADTTNATTNDRVRLYINGERVTSLSTNTQPSQNYQGRTNDTKSHNICGYLNGNTSNAYLAEVNFIDGSALDPTSFGETKSGVWIPKAYSGSYGTNGFHLEFAGNANDSSGNSNNFTANNLSSHDYVPDSPTNNFATLSVLAQDRYSSRATLAEGNLRATGTDKWGQSSFRIPSSGKWYFEMRAQTSSTSNRDGFGITDVMVMGSASTPYYSIYRSNGVKTTSGGEVSYGASWTSGDILGCAVDATAGSVVFYKNGTSQGTAYTGFDFEADAYFPTVYPRSISTGANLVANFGQDSTFAGGTTAGGNSDANGYGDFKYAPPSDYLALCTENLTVAEGVDPMEDNSPQDHFNTLIYTGDGSTSRSLTGVGFTPDFGWFKNRDNGSRYYLIADTLRGANKQLFSNVGNSEESDTTQVKGFLSDGYTLGNNLNVNQSGSAHVVWNWKGGGSGVSNSDGSNTTAVVSANTDAGISIVTYTGNGVTGQTMGHGLNQQPDSIWIKNRSNGYNWNVWQTGLSGLNYILYFNSSSNEQADGNIKSLSSTTFGVSNGESCGFSGNNYVAYVFHKVEGFSSFGSYVGNGSSDGPFVYTGFRPAFILVKKTSAAENWSMADTARSPYNVSQAGLQPSTSNAENTTSGFAVDLVSDGFKPRDPAGQYNDNGASYVYWAFAENPFKYANAR